MEKNRKVEERTDGSDARGGAGESTPPAGSGSERTAAVPSPATDGEPPGEAAAADGYAAALQDLQRDLDRMNDRHLRLAAEFDNYRKRTDRERTEVYARAQADLVKRLLDVVDDLQRVAHYDETTPVASLLDGVQLVEKKMMQALTSAGLESVDAQGELFDPACMEALATVEAEHPEEDEVVSDVFQPGYRFQGHLVRPARVRVKKYEA